MLINSEDIKQTKENIEVMQAFIDGKEIEFKRKFQSNVYRTAKTPSWDFSNFAYRVKQSEPEFKYPIYKRLKLTPETIVKFTSLTAGIYVSTHSMSHCKPGNYALHMAPHTDSSWEDCIVSLDEEKTMLGHSNTEELFEVIYYCDIMKEYEFVKQLYKEEYLENKKHLQKTGRSFIIDKDTKKIIKINNN